MKLSVIGAGYVGLVSGACLADKGHDVICVDADEKKVKKLNSGVMPIYEPSLGGLLERNVNSTLTATKNTRQAVLDTDLSLIAVGTPFNGQKIDLSCIEAVCREIGAALKDKESYHVVAVKSTVVPGTTDDVVLPILERASGKKAGVDFGVGVNPEFLREGQAVEDFMSPDRIVLGGVDRRTHEVLKELYKVFADVEIVVTNNKTAEMIKYTANSLLATMISFSNEIGNLCASIEDVDALEVMNGVHLDRRLTPILETGERVWPGIIAYLKAGCGFGGSCFQKDIQALIAHGQGVGQPMSLLEAVIDINGDQPKRVLDLLKKHVTDPSGVRIAVLGLAFKEGTDDMRESPAIPIIKSLQNAGAYVNAYDPMAQGEAQKIFGHVNIRYADKIEHAIQGTSAIILLTRQAEFQRLPNMIKEMKQQPVLIDGRRALSKDCGIVYEGVGL